METGFSEFACMACAGIGCTGDEIATVVGCCRDTLYARFSDTLKKGQDQAKASLRRMQWKAASAGNVTMLIWLGKNLLGQSSNHEIKGSEQPVIQVIHYGDEKPCRWGE